MNDTDRVIEFEVYSPTLEQFLGAAKVVNETEADELARTLEAKSGLGWYVREVVLNERPIPMWSPLPNAITVEEARSLAARHGQDRMVIIAWNAQNKMVNVVTAGSSLEHSNASLALSQFILRAMGFNPDADKQPLEDRRHEHAASAVEKGTPEGVEPADCAGIEPSGPCPDSNPVHNACAPD